MPRRSTGPHRRAGARRPRHVALGTALALLLATLAAAASSTAASASPQTDLASATAQAQQLQAQIDANSQRADILDEQYLQAQAAIASTNTQIGATQRSIATAEARAQTLHRQLGDRAALLYMGAGNTDPIGMDAATFQDLGSRAKYSEAAAAKDSQILGDLKVTEEQLRSQRQDLQRQLSVAQGQQRAAQKARAWPLGISSSFSPCSTKNGGASLCAYEIGDAALNRSGSSA